MPIVPFASLPDSARVWVFASDQPLTGAAADTLLAAVDGFLAAWRAHGLPLRCARDWRDGRFLAIGVDVDIEKLRQELRPSGDQAATLVLLPRAGHPTAILAERM